MGCSSDGDKGWKENNGCRDKDDLGRWEVVKTGSGLCPAVGLSTTSAEAYDYDTWPVVRIVR